MLIDSHANLHGDAYGEDLGAVLERARSAGVSPIIAICCRLSEFGAVSAIADAHEDVWCTLGAHPHHAKDRPDITADGLLALAGGHQKLVAIGETGLDLHYNYSPFEQQLASLKAHIEAARITGLPIILHCRDADEAMADLLEEEMGKGAFKALLHCYTGGEALARRASTLGVWFSASGIITFKKADDVRAIFRDIIPDDKLIVETDCPYLAPVPHRGSRNEPAFLPHVVEKLAELRGWTIEEAQERTTQNCLALFDRIKVPG